MRFRSLGSAVATLLLAALPLSAHALDQRFTDANGDMVADVPSDPKLVIDPPVLIFSYTPVEDPAMYAKVWDGFIKHMEKVTGKRVQFFPVQSNAAQLEAMSIVVQARTAGVMAAGIALATGLATGTGSPTGSGTPPSGSTRKILIMSARSSATYRCSPANAKCRGHSPPVSTSATSSGAAPSSAKTAIVPTPRLPT